MDDWLLENLVCPRDKTRLQFERNTLICSQLHRYPIVNGIPIILPSDAEPTQPEYTRSIEAAFSNRVRVNETNGTGVDSYVQRVIRHTGGSLYGSLVNRLSRYPIPDIALPECHGSRLLDIGCNWGRWSISAARKGYAVVGIDSSLEGIEAAIRVARQLDARVHFLVADARYPPFPSNLFDVVFSYSVIQHFSKDDARRTFQEVFRILKASGVSLIQMPNCYGLRNIQNQIGMMFKKNEPFDVRYWTPKELKSSFETTIGPSEILVDGFFSLNPQKADLDLLPFRYRVVVRASEFLSRLSEHRGARCLAKVADSLYIRSTKRAPS